MNDDELERILSEEEILPSSGFTASVMDAVRREAQTPAPIPFPWKRALPGMIVAALTIMLAAAAILLYVVSSSTSSAPPERVNGLSNWLLQLIANPVFRAATLALVLSFFSVVIPLRFGVRRV